jgi:hypothetical protein
MRFVNYSWVNLFFSWKNDTLPDNFKDMFVSNEQMFGLKRSLRIAKSFRIPFCRARLKQFSVRFQGLKFSNSLPVEFTTASFSSNFKHKLLSFLQSSYASNVYFDL